MSAEAKARRAKHDAMIAALPVRGTKRLGDLLVQWSIAGYAVGKTGWAFQHGETVTMQQAKNARALLDQAYAGRHGNFTATDAAELLHVIKLLTIRIEAAKPLGNPSRPKARGKNVKPRVTFQRSDGTTVSFRGRKTR